MEIFFSNDIRVDVLRLDAEEALHCVRVLRHRSGDTVNVIDGRGNLYHCTLLSDEAAGGKRAGGEGVEARIESVEANWHSHPYHLTLAVCPTKNPDRYEWMAEKATEVGLDRLVPVIGDRSERKFVGKTARLERVLLSAAKQSLKARLPELAEAVSVRDFVAGSGEVGSNVAGCVVAGGELAGGELAGDGLAGCGLAGDGLAGRQLPSPPLPPRTKPAQKTSGDGSAEPSGGNFGYTSAIPQLNFNAVAQGYIFHTLDGGVLKSVVPTEPFYSFEALRGFFGAVLDEDNLLILAKLWKTRRQSVIGVLREILSDR